MPDDRVDWFVRLQRAFARAGAAPEPAVLEELAQHAEAAFDGAIAEGCAEIDAHKRVDALIDVWIRETPALRHRVRRTPPVPPPAEARGSLWSGYAQDLKYALRVLVRQPRFAVLVVLTLALGIGSTTALFSVTYGVLMKPLPWVEPGRLVQLKEQRGGHAPRFGSFSNTAYLAWREAPALIEELGAWAPRSGVITEGGDPERLRMVAVSASVFRVLGLRAVAGALFEEQDERSRVILFSEALWRRRFGSDPAVIGRSVTIDGEAYSVLGIVPDAVGFPDRGIQAWVPFQVPPVNGNLLSMFEAVARVRPDASAEQAAAEGTARGRFAADTGMTTMAIFGSNGPIEIRATPYREAVTAGVRQPLTVLLGAVGLLLLIAVTNVAGLQLARAASRRRELAIRASIGASVPRLIRQQMIENLTLGAVGGACGLALAWLLLRSAPSILPSDFPRAMDLSMNSTVVLAAIGATVVVSGAVGLFVALRFRRLDLTQTLVEDGRAPAGLSARTGVARARLGIVTAQIALASMLLVGALLLGRSFYAQLGADRGYDPADVLSARLSLPSTSYTPSRRSEALTEIVEQLRSIPAVRAAAITTELPTTPGGSTSGFTLSLPSSTGTTRAQASPRVVSPGYFETLGLRILTGRSLADTDTVTSEPVVVVNETFQRQYFPDGAVGRTLPMAASGQNQDGDALIVGVVEDVRYLGAATTSLPELYFSHRQLKGGLRLATAALFVRGQGDPWEVAEPLRSTVRNAGGGMIAENIMTLEDRLLSGSLARPRLYAVLVASFAVLALIVTAVGLFSVLSYTVAQRTRELGVRAALGARRVDLVRLVLRQGAGMAVMGLTAGLIAALWCGRYVAGLLYGIEPYDVSTYALAAIVLLAVVLLACAAPAVRAARLDPQKALRS